MRRIEKMLYSPIMQAPAMEPQQTTLCLTQRVQALVIQLIQITLVLHALQM